jgi:hypothetical protein
LYKSHWSTKPQSFWEEPQCFDDGFQNSFGNWGMVDKTVKSVDNSLKLVDKSSKSVDKCHLH